MKFSASIIAISQFCAISTTSAFTSPAPQIGHVGSLRHLPCPLASSTVMDDVSTQSASPQIQIGDEDENDVEPAAKSYLDDGFVFGMDGSGLERPKGKVANVVVEGDSLETTPQQVALVSGTFLSHALISALAIQHELSLTDGNVALTAAITTATVASSWLMADLGSGVLHWSVDNYGNGRTPVMGGIIAAFQGHHSAPWTITYRDFCNNVWKLCIPFGIPTVAAISLLAGPNHPMISLFFAVFCSMEILSQEFHKWSHQTKKEVPSWVNALQDNGISIGRVQHAQHHKAPYDGNYCIVSGQCNELLDTSGFFRWMEHQVYKINGIEANSWKLDANLRERTLGGEYRLPQ